VSAAEICHTIKVYANMINRRMQQNGVQKLHPDEQVESIVPEWQTHNSKYARQEDVCKM
jgi:hypothetical protein